MRGMYVTFWNLDSLRLLRLTQSAGKNDEYESVSGADGLLLSAGDPAGPDEPIKKSVALQVGLVAYPPLEVTDDGNRLGCWVLSFHRLSFSSERTT